MEPQATAARERLHRLLRTTALLYLAGYAIHGVDHLVRGLDKTPDPVGFAGIGGFFAAFAAIALILRRHPMSAQIAVVIGLGTALAVTAIHVPPEWGMFSQPFRDDVTALDWASVASSVVTALAFGLAGLYALRSERSREAAPLRVAARG